MSTRLDNEFTVPVPTDQAWAALLDVERIAPCMPGATLDSIDGDAYTGRVKVKVGPITVTYRGQARIVKREEADHVAVIEAKGKEARGSGTAEAHITAALHEEDGATRVSVSTDLNVTGRVAQFGRGVMADVSAKLVDKFAANLAEELAKQPAENAAATETEEPIDTGSQEPAPEPPRASRTYSVEGGFDQDSEEEAIDLVKVAGAPVAKRVLAAVGAAIVGFLLLRWLRRRIRR